jgi:hypothetical protein
LDIGFRTTDIVKCHLSRLLSALLADIWSNVAMEPIQPPAFDDLVAELTLLRRTGITEIRRLELPALSVAVRAVGHESAVIEAPQLERLVREGIDQLAGGRLADSAALLLGLESGTRADTPTQLREDAAERWGVSVSQFRHRWEPLVIDQLAEAILTCCQQHTLRVARLAMERRTPVTSRLAVSWVERFEAMYRLWTPIYAFGADLTAYRSTQIRPDDIPADMSVEEQADGYVAFALHHFARVLVESRRFERRYGGLWLLSDAQAEQELADALYRIGWHTPNNERDDSYLRQLVDEDSEVHPFLESIDRDSVGRAILHEWQTWTAECSCVWTPSGDKRALFPTAQTYERISRRCGLHAVVRACSDFCLLLDDDWHRIADWYHLPSPRPTGVNATDLIDGSRPK